MAKVYIDTNVFVDALLTNFTRRDEHTQRLAKNTLDEFKEGRKSIGYISNLVLIELMNTCQKIESYDNEMDELDEAGLGERIRTRGNDSYERLMQTIMKRYKIKIIPDKKLNYKKMIGNSLVITRESVGSVRPREDRFHRFKRAGLADVLHLLIAKSYRCNMFYTFDAGIAAIDHPLLDGLSIRNIRHGTNPLDAN